MNRTILFHIGGDLVEAVGWREDAPPGSCLGCGHSLDALAATAATT